MRLMCCSCRWLSLWMLFAGVGVATAQVAPLPEGDSGISAAYPDDAGIDQDAAVIFAHGFEDAASAEDLRRTWDVVFHDRTIAITDDAVNVHSGTKALELVFPQTTGDVGNGLMKRLVREQDVVFLRYYQKFDPALDVDGAGSFHNGGSISARYHVDGRSTPGKRADGRNKYLVAYECSVYSDAPAPGHLGVYIYHPEQRGDYGDLFFPTGVVQPNTSLPSDFGEHFVPRPNALPQLDRWHCYEFMLQANTAGQRDGRIACWLDGQLIADFQNLRLRDIETLKIDYLTIGGYINPNRVRTNRIWFDDVVAATAYIGPRRAAKP